MHTGLPYDVKRAAREATLAVAEASEASGSYLYQITGYSYILKNAKGCRDGSAKKQSNKVWMAV